MTWLTWLVGMATAGSGPWVPGSGSGSLYLGADAQQIHTLQATVGGERTTSDVDEGLNQLNFTGVATYGVAPRAEVEVVVPVQFVHTNREDGPLCTALGPGSCDRTRGVGTISSHIKVLVADELAGAPVSASIAGVVRFGALTAETRSRLTNIGEGTLDGGAKLSLGKSGALGEGYWSSSLDSTFLYRVPNTRSFPGQRGDAVAPASDLLFNLDSFFAPKRAVAVGPSANLLWRPGGLDFDEVDLTDVDRFAALRVAQLNVGGKLVFRDTRDNAFVLGVFHTAWAVNNPADQVGVSVGMVLSHIFDRRVEK